MAHYVQKRPKIIKKPLFICFTSLSLGLLNSILKQFKNEKKNGLFDSMTVFCKPDSSNNIFIVIKVKITKMSSIVAFLVYKHQQNGDFQNTSTFI